MHALNSDKYRQIALLKGNQLGAYGPIYHRGGFHQCPKINSVKT